MDVTLATAIISAASVLSGVFVTAFTQHLLAKSAASREEKRQRRIEFRNQFQECVVKLLEATDPDIHPVPSAPEITRNIILLQLYLDLQNKEHRKLNGCLNQLALAVSGYSNTESSKSLVLRSHAEFLDAAGKMFRQI